MKTTIKIIAALLLITAFASSCKRKKGCTDIDAINYDQDARKDDGSCEFMGEVTFWSNKQDTCGDIRIELNGEYIGSINTFFKEGEPNCAANGTVSIQKAPGNYNYTGEDNCGFWIGTVIVTSQGCYIEMLE